MMLAAVEAGNATALGNKWQCMATQANQSTWQGAALPLRQTSSPTTELLLNGAVAP